MVEYEGKATQERDTFIKICTNIHTFIHRSNGLECQMDHECCDFDNDCLPNLQHVGQFDMVVRLNGFKTNKHLDLHKVLHVCNKDGWKSVVTGRPTLVLECTDFSFNDMSCGCGGGSAGQPTPPPGLARAAAA